MGNCLQDVSVNSFLGEKLKEIIVKRFKRGELAAVVHLNFQVGSTFPVPVCTVPSSIDRTSRCNKVDAVRLYASYRLNLLLLKGQRCVGENTS